MSAIKFKLELVEVADIVLLGPPDPGAQGVALIAPPLSPGEQGPPFVHTQSSASSTWTVNHNLGWRPLITVLSPGGAEVVAGVTHASVNQAIITFTQPQSGTALAR